MRNQIHRLFDPDIVSCIDELGRIIAEATPIDSDSQVSDRHRPQHL